MVDYLKVHFNNFESAVARNCWNDGGLQKFIHFIFIVISFAFLLFLYILF